MRSLAARIAGPRGRTAVRRVRRAMGRSSAPVISEHVLARYTPDAEGPRVLWPLFPPLRYLGQLQPSFQEKLAAERRYLNESDCDFYHAVELPDGRVIDGHWDLRGREFDYLGGYEVGGRRVLELGPASGGLTFFMERQGAKVVGIDAGFDLSVDLVPYECRDLTGERLDITRRVGATQNAWWYVHQRLGSKAAMVYAPIYELPADLGRFDVAVFGSILLHLRRPFDALEQAARLTDRAIVVTEAFDPHLAGVDDAVVRWNPARERHPGTLWWSFTPVAIQEMLLTLGFPNSNITVHHQFHHRNHLAGSPPEPMDMFTVVATR